jgi:hypothetical protein
MEDTNPETEVSVEERLEAVFERQNPTKEAPEATPEVEEEEAEDAPKAEKEDEPEEIEGEEVEIDGETYRVPPKLKEAFLKSKDYTQKTQAVAEQRKALEERQEALKQAEQAQQAAFEKRVEIKALEKQLQAYDQIDWAALAESDPAQAMKLSFSREALLKQQAKAEQEMSQVQQQAKEMSAQQRQQALARDAEILTRDIKGWGPELGRKIAEYGKSHGYTEQELANVTARDIKVLHEAYLYRELQASKALTQKKVLDVKPVTVKAARSAPSVQGQQATEDARSRLKKTGNPQDAEAFFERLYRKK